MDEKNWIKLGDQTAGNLRASQSTYMLAVSALTAIIVFAGDALSDSSFLLTVSAIGVGLFGLLTFENSQQSFMALMKGMPDSMAGTEMGAAFKRTPFIVFRRKRRAGDAHRRGANHSGELAECLVGDEVGRLLIPRQCCGNTLALTDTLRCSGGFSRVCDCTVCGELRRWS